jgi:hypothetical protein
MQVRNATPLAIALAALMASPLVLAQSDTTSATSQNATARQPMTPLNSDISISTFNHLDTNHDGRVSVAEARADSSFNNSFGKLDADRNGYVSNDELTAASGDTTGTASTGDATSTTTTTTSGSTSANPPVTYGNASDSTYESSNSTDTTGTDTSTTTTDTSATNATDNGTTDNSTTTTTTKKSKKHKSP